MDMFIQQVTRFVAETAEQIIFTKRFNQVRHILKCLFDPVLTLM
jgi:hypothetical protein